MRIFVASLLLVMATPFVAAEDDHDPICPDGAEFLCIDPDVEACFAWSSGCIDPDHPVQSAKDTQRAVEDLFGPCICDPQPDPW